MMADKWEPGPDGIDAARAWLRGEIKKQGSPRDAQARDERLHGCCETRARTCSPFSLPPSKTVG